ncbi:oligosaccharide flippase family protein [Arthrobacter sp. OV608]|uniref:oligosaccharide flippase family protein n=1 Tax=Arthrobacter sp. OV608 TaxID=1882768 RepID=UPI0008B43746|nr:oligosaccharide flippase family protein [Arthrobacter sp. OV608]SEP86397.1 Membrane protein involved in the export of O-antigen and teichoic acid [Arthrobacter sp. OV608]
MKHRAAGRQIIAPNKNILGSATWATLQQIISMAATAVSGIILARVLGVAEFGIFSYATNLANIGMSIVTAGLAGLAIKSLVENPEHQRRTMTALIVIREFFAVLAYALLLSVSLTAGQSVVLEATAVALLVLISRGFDATEYWFQARVESRKSAVVRISVVLAFLAARLCAAVLGVDLWIFLWMYVAESVFISLGLLLRFYLDRQSVGLGRPRIHSVHQLLGKSWILLLSGIAQQVNSRGDILIIQALVGSVGVGIYAAASRFSEMFYFLPVVFMTATFPSLIRVRKKYGGASSQYRRSLQRSYDLACWTGIGIAAAAFLLGPAFLTLLYGSDYSLSGQILQIHVLALPFVFMGAVFSKWILVEDLLFASLIRHFLGAALNIGLNFLLIPTMGLAGAAVATLVSYIVASFLSCFIGTSTRPAGLQMALALIAPVRYLIAFMGGKGTEMKISPNLRKSLGRRRHKVIQSLRSGSRIHRFVYYSMFSDAFKREEFVVAKGHQAFAKRYADGKQEFLLRRNIHMLEKGLTMVPRRETFGVDYIAETVALLRSAKDHQPKFISDEVQDWAREVLRRYFEATELSTSAVIRQAQSTFYAIDWASDGSPESGPHAPYTDEPPVDIETLTQLAVRRKSVRWFEPKPVPRELVDLAMNVAREAPSACNRQPFTFRIFDDPEMIRQVAAVPMGTAGYGHNLPGLAVIVGDLSAFSDERDRHLIYTDGCLAAMSFILGLEAQNVASVCINWPDILERDKRMGKLLGLNSHERVVMLIGFGFADSASLTPYSAKRDLDALRSYNTL